MGRERSPLQDGGSWLGTYHRGQPVSVEEWNEHAREGKGPYKDPVGVRGRLDVAVETEWKRMTPELPGVIDSSW